MDRLPRQQVAEATDADTGDGDISAIAASAVTDEADDTCGGAELLIYSEDLGAVASVVVSLRRFAAISAATTPIAAQETLISREPRLVVVDLRRTASDALAFARLARTNCLAIPIAATATVASLAESHDALSSLGVRVILTNSTRTTQFLDAVAGAARTVDADVRIPVLRRATRNAIDYFSLHYAEVTHGSELARLTNASFFHLAHLFRADLNMSIKQYMTEVRVEIACQLVVGSTDKIGHIADQTGFSDASHFSRTFLRHVGKRPAEYRRVGNDKREYRPRDDRAEQTRMLRRIA